MPQRRMRRVGALRVPVGLRTARPVAGRPSRLRAGVRRQGHRRKVCTRRVVRRAVKMSRRDGACVIAVVGEGERDAMADRRAAEPAARLAAAGLCLDPNAPQLGQATVLFILDRQQCFLSRDDAYFGLVRRVVGPDVRPAGWA